MRRQAHRAIPRLIMMFKPEKIQDNARTSTRDARDGTIGGCEDRFLRLGVRALATPELVGWVFGAGGPVSAEETARGLLKDGRTLESLAHERPAVLARYPGMGPVRARRLLAAFELGFRATAGFRRTGQLVRRPVDLHGLLRDEFRGLDRERFLALYLDSRHRVGAIEIVSQGSLNASLVHPREVFKPAVAASAAAVIVAHNHPSGDSRPSGDDLELTARLARCGDLLGIALLDHLVVGDESVTSIREYGWPAPGVD